jgi:hypothetical protein
MAEESPAHGPTDQGDGEPVHEPMEISYAEYLHRSTTGDRSQTGD